MTLTVAISTKGEVWREPTVAELFAHAARVADPRVARWLQAWAEEKAA